jgi:hypothetical protein
MFSLQQNQRPRGQNRLCPEAGVGWYGGGGKVAQIMYTCISKCKNNKINFFLKRKNGKKTHLDMFNTHAIFFWNIFYP